jgi:hypothetical protein
MTTSIAAFLGTLIGLVLVIPISIFIFWISDKIDDYKDRRIQEKSEKKENMNKIHTIEPIPVEQIGRFWNYCDSSSYVSLNKEKPGYQQESFIAYTLVNHLKVDQIIQLEDCTILIVVEKEKKYYKVHGLFVYGYKFRILINKPERFVNPEMLAEGRSFYIKPSKI